MDLQHNAKFMEALEAARRKIEESESIKNDNIQ